MRFNKFPEGTASQKQLDNKNPLTNCKTQRTVKRRVEHNSAPFEIPFSLLFSVS